jgi:ketosteroid isomerase-like protein
MPTPPSPLWRAFYAALADGDLPTALARLGDSVIWHEAPGMPYEGRALYHGAQQVAEHVLARIAADVDHLALTNREVIGLGTTVYAAGQLLQRPPAGLAPSAPGLAKPAPMAPGNLT